MSKAAAMLNASGVRVDADGVVLLEAIELQLHAGEVLGIVGPNGAGKSTLLKVLAGLRATTAGTVRLDGKPLSAIEASALARQLAYLEQRPQVFWPLAVEQIVALGRLPHGDADTAAGQQAIAQALAATETQNLRSRAFHTLSEGEKMRVHLARLLAGTPRIVLADEPVAALDPWHQLQVLELLRSEAARGATVAIVLHDLQLAARYCDRLLVLDQGRICAAGTPATVLSRDLLARIWRIDAHVDSATLTVTIHGPACAHALRRGEPDS